jgi:hypothetical protein
MRVAIAVNCRRVQRDTTAHRRSAIGGRTTRHAGYAVSQQKRKLVEQGFGWMKTVGGLRNFIIEAPRSSAGYSPSMPLRTTELSAQKMSLDYPLCASQAAFSTISRI